MAHLKHYLCNRNEISDAKYGTEPDKQTRLDCGDHQ